ncbi:hypothetical protein COTS27_01255 [Spirochaetota bacterium]|nr:hypothetical protein COTS27_01255 [Spirochaetota bacterium]
MANETVTANFFRKYVWEDELYKNKKVIMDEETSESPKIDELLKNASKNINVGGKGFPDFIIRYKENSDIVIVVECKPDISKHESNDRTNYQDYAVDGVLHYSKFLSKEYDVIAIAVSGCESENRISHFLQSKNQEPISKYGDKLLPLENYLDYKKNENFNEDYKKLLKYAEELNKKMHSLKIQENKRSLLFSGILIALENKAFRESYDKETTSKALAKTLVNRINEELSSTQKKEHAEAITESYKFIENTTLMEKFEEFKEIIKKTDKEINNFEDNYKYFDTLGQFYIRFLRYANNDKSLGIVLTPPHITELFCDIVTINKDSVVLDTCTGTGGFLISAMQKMIKDAKEDKNKEAAIKEKQIIGVELQNEIFSLLCSNMHIHGDGRSNLIKGDCFDPNIKGEVEKFKPNVGFLNPPYKTKRDDPLEFKFVLNNLEQLEMGSHCVAIIPMRCVLNIDDKKNKALKKELLSKHTLDAVFSMPSELFHDSKATVATCICVLKAKEPHPKDYKTYFGMWKDDKFIKIKKMGRVDHHNTWQGIKNDWINNYKNKDEIPGHSIKKAITYHDEWCFEAYFKIEYHKIKKADFEKYIKQYISTLFLYEKIDTISKDAVNDQKSNSTHDIDKKEFGWFDLLGENGILCVEKGKRLNRVKRKEGEIPLLTSSSYNNGISELIDGGSFSDKKNKKHSNKITIDMLSNVFYHGYEYYGDDNIHTLSFKKEYEKGNNPYVCIFMTVLLKMLRVRYQYGRQVRIKRLETEQFQLPINNEKSPDWQFMEDYIKSLPYSINLCFPENLKNKSIKKS